AALVPAPLEPFYLTRGVLHRGDSLVHCRFWEILRPLGPLPAAIKKAQRSRRTPAMASAQLGTVLRHIRRLAAAPAVRELADGQLLEQFANQHDQAAFAELVRRHGPLVWGIGCHVLHHHQDAEDAFQATFLALALKAASLQTLKTLAGWL